MPDPNQNRTQYPTASSVASGTLIGAPLATIIVWYFNTFVFPGKIPIEIATALGSVITTLTATFYHIAGQLFAKLGLSLTPPPAE